jgi:hypothetical protein
VEMLIASGRVARYTVNGDDYLFVRHWFQHQRVDKPQKSLLPAPPDEMEDSAPVPSAVVEPSPNVRRPFVPERSGAERSGDGTEMERSGADGVRSAPTRDDIDPVVRDTDRAAPPAPLVELPTDALRFVEQLYSLGSEKRQLDVRRQLYDTLDPRAKGARLRRGAYVKARSPEHLAQCCRAVMEDPPRNIDAAIVIVLEKLSDPPPGPTPAEQHTATESARVAAEELYQRAAKAAGVQWAKEHPADYEPIRVQVEHELHAAGDGAFGRMAKDSLLVQRCAAAAGFAEFDVWNAQRRESAA